MKIHTGITQGSQFNPNDTILKLCWEIIRIYLEFQREIRCPLSNICFGTCFWNIAHFAFNIVTTVYIYAKLL